MQIIHTTAEGAAAGAGRRDADFAQDRGAREHGADGQRTPTPAPDTPASTEINRLLQQAAHGIGAALAAESAALLLFPAGNTDSCCCASTGWERSAAARIGKQLCRLVQEPAGAGRRDVTPALARTPGRVYLPPAAFLRQHGLTACLIATVPCGEGRLAAVAACSAPGVSLDTTLAPALLAILAVASLGITQARFDGAPPHGGQGDGAGLPWEALLDGMPQLVCLLDGNGRVLHANRTLAAWRRDGCGTPTGASVHDLLHPGCREQRCPLKARWEDLWRQSFTRARVECSYHDAVLGRDLHCQLSRGAESPDGAGPGVRENVLLVIEDTSRRTRTDRMLADYTGEMERLVELRTEQLALATRRLEEEAGQHRDDRQALGAAQKKYTCLMEFSLTGFYIARGSRVVECNGRFADLFGYTGAEVCRLELSRLFPHGAAGSPVDAPHIVRGVTRDGRDIWLHRSEIRVDCLGEPGLTLGNVIDVTTEKQTEHTLACLLCEKKILSQRLLQAQESERKLISAELHDSIGQGISAVKFGIENVLHDAGAPLPPAVRHSLAGAVGKLRDTIEEVRRISMDLRPSMLDDLGLLATMSWFCREYRALFPQVDLDVHTGIEEGAIPDALKVVIFRILQEALNNIGKHARAGRVTVELARRQGEIVFSIADDGKGFSAHGATTRQGFGLSSMRERARLSGGELAVSSAPGAGTHVLAHWPAAQ